MEEILASIRRIISDDQDMAAEAVRPSDKVESVLTRSILEDPDHPGGAAPLPASLTAPLERIVTPERDDVVSPKPARSHMTRPEAPPVYKIQTSEAESGSRDGMVAKVERPAEPLVSAQAGASVLSAFDRLGAAANASAPKTLEDLAKELLRPMLKTWLDDNLPTLVERLVQAEIQRLSRART